MYLSVCRLLKTVLVRLDLELKPVEDTPAWKSDKCFLQELCVSWLLSQLPSLTPKAFLCLHLRWVFIIQHTVTTLKRSSSHRCLWIKTFNPFRLNFITDIFRVVSLVLLSSVSYGFCSLVLISFILITHFLVFPLNSVTVIILFLFILMFLETTIIFLNKIYIRITPIWFWFKLYTGLPI